MTFYMLRDKITGLFYKVQGGRGGQDIKWMEQEGASVTSAFANAKVMLSIVKDQNHFLKKAGFRPVIEPEIVTYTATETKLDEVLT